MTFKEAFANWLPAMKWPFIWSISGCSFAVCFALNSFSPATPAKAAAMNLTALSGQLLQRTVEIKSCLVCWSRVGQRSNWDPIIRPLGRHGINQLVEISLVWCRILILCVQIQICNWELGSAKIQPNPPRTQSCFQVYSAYKTRKTRNNFSKYHNY